MNGIRILIALAAVALAAFVVAAPASSQVLGAGTPYGIPPWLAGLVGVAMFGLGAAVTRRRRPAAEDVAV